MKIKKVLCMIALLAGIGGTGHGILRRLGFGGPSLEDEVRRVASNSKYSKNEIDGLTRKYPDIDELHLLFKNKILNFETDFETILKEELKKELQDGKLTEDKHEILKNLLERLEVEKQQEELVLEKMELENLLKKLELKELMFKKKELENRLINLKVETDDLRLELKRIKRENIREQIKLKKQLEQSKLEEKKQEKKSLEQKNKQKLMVQLKEKELEEKELEEKELKEQLKELESKKKELEKKEQGKLLLKLLQKELTGLEKQEELTMLLEKNEQEKKKLKERLKDLEGKRKNLEKKEQEKLKFKKKSNDFFYEKFFTSPSENLAEFAEKRLKIFNEKSGEYNTSIKSHYVKIFHFENAKPIDNAINKTIGQVSSKIDELETEMAELLIKLLETRNKIKRNFIEILNPSYQIERVEPLLDGKVKIIAQNSKLLKDGIDQLKKDGKTKLHIKFKIKILNFEDYLKTQLEKREWRKKDFSTAFSHFFTKNFEDLQSMEPTSLKEPIFLKMKKLLIKLIETSNKMKTKFIEIAEMLSYPSYQKKLRKNMASWIDEQTKKKIETIKEFTDEFKMTHLITETLKAELNPAQLEMKYKYVKTIKDEYTNYPAKKQFDIYLSNRIGNYKVLSAKYIYICAQIWKNLPKWSQKNTLLNRFKVRAAEKLSIENKENKFNKWLKMVETKMTKEKSFKEFSIKDDESFFYAYQEAEETYRNTLNEALLAILIKLETTEKKKNLKKKIEESLKRENIGPDIIRLAIDKDGIVQIIPPARPKDQPKTPPPSLPKKEKRRKPIEVLSELIDKLKKEIQEHPTVEKRKQLHKYEEEWDRLHKEEFERIKQIYELSPNNPAP